eukprot:4899396-Alexandrium_andersonii.AAC.1
MLAAPRLLLPPSFAPSTRPPRLAAKSRNGQTWKKPQCVCAECWLLALVPHVVQVVFARRAH